MVDKKTDNKKIIHLILDMEFYSIVIYIVLNVLGIIKNINPIKSILAIFYCNWFGIYYIILYLISPYLNHLLNTLPKAMLKKLLITLLIITSIIPTFMGAWDFNGHAAFIRSYLIGGYIKLYHNKPNETSKIRILLIYTISITLLCILSFYIIGIKFKLLPFIYEYPKKILCDNNSIFVTIIAICIFLLFKNKKVKYNKHINIASTTALGIYLIHDNFLLRDIIWNKIVPINLYLNKWYFLSYAISKIIIVLITCYILVRLKQILLDKYFNNITNKISKTIEELKKKGKEYGI